MASCFCLLISGRNPDFLIGQQVMAAPILKNYRMEVLPTGYMLINPAACHRQLTSATQRQYPEDKYGLAASTALAGEMLGLKLIYLDAGSGAEREINARMINTVRKAIQVPLIVGGGINTPAKAQAALEAGADMIWSATHWKTPNCLPRFLIVCMIGTWSWRLAVKQQWYFRLYTICSFFPFRVCRSVRSISVRWHFFFMVYYLTRTGKSGDGEPKVPIVPW